MKKPKTYLLYKIYYNTPDGEQLVYLGRTTQILQDRIRGHVFGNRMMRKIDIFQVSRIEYAELETCADMYLYEIYYINLYHPVLNKDDKAKDDLTVSLTELPFVQWNTPLWGKWKQEIAASIAKNTGIQISLDNLLEKHREEKQGYLDDYKKGLLTHDQYLELSDELLEEEARFRYDNGLISFSEFKQKMGFCEAGC